MFKRSSFLLLTTAGAVLAGAATAQEGCSDLSDLDLENFPDLEVSAAWEEAPVPHCLVEGSFERRTGVDGVEYAIGFALALPEDWENRFLFQGGGGLNGVVREPLGAAAAGDQSALARGFAVASTDSGHEGAVFDRSFQADQLAMLNFAQGAVPKVAELAEEIIAAHYGSAAETSYYAGCSTGGREGMMAAQRFPRHFDGVLAGAPAMRTDHSNAALAAKAVAMNRVAANGPDRSAVFSEDDRQTLLTGVREACDGLDGLEDGMIFDVRACASAFDPADLVCTGEGDEGCLSAEQADLAQVILGPTTDSTGWEVYPEFPADTGLMVPGEDDIPGLFRFDDPANRQASNTATDLSVDDIVARDIRAGGQQWLVNTDRWTNLTSFAGNGGRIMFYHGMSDPWFSANDTIRYVEALEGASADAAAFYLVPGMGHCDGGPATLDQFDLLTPLVEWVESDEVPGPVTATGEVFPERSRPLCRYPEHAQYDGEGAKDDAASFACVESSAD